eukprot:UN23620
MDTAATEYLFIIRFFNDQNLFNVVFEKTLALFMEKLQDFLTNCYDCLCLVLMIRILREQQNVMNGRNLKCLNAFFDRMNMKLWPRFKIIFDDNLGSLRHFKITKDDLKILQTSQSSIHFTTLRYANFVNGLLLLNRQKNDDSIANARYITSNLTVLREEMETLLSRLANHIQIPKKKCVFLINNYDVIVTIT